MARGGELPRQGDTESDSEDLLVRPLTEQEWIQILDVDETERSKNVKDILARFTDYFLFHFLFFGTISAQNYFFSFKETFQFSFLILVAFYLKIVFAQFGLLKDKRMLQQRRWEKRRVHLRIVEHLLYAVTHVLLPLYLLKFPFEFSAFYLLVLPFVSSVINLIFLRYQQSPCNATFQIAVKSVLILRLLVALFVVIKIEGTFGPDNEWSWQKTFWAFWISLTMQAVLLVACVVVFLNTLLGFVKGEQSYHDILGSFWITILIGGFLLSSLEMVLQIVRIFDTIPTIS